MPYLWITNSSSNEKIKHSSQNPPPPPPGDNTILPRPVYHVHNGLR